jgi:ribonuclease VapC
MGCRCRRRTLIVVDASAIIAMLFDEPMAAALIDRLSRDADRFVSVASYLEAGTVLAGRRRSDRINAIDDLDAFLTEAEIFLAPIDEAQARLALHARIVYGRGMGHGGSLNFGDTFSYALAKSLNCPLLFIGDDFTTTDITSAL